AVHSSSNSNNDGIAINVRGVRELFKLCKWDSWWHPRSPRRWNLSTWRHRCWGWIA
ncbi:hypothetical protein HDV00_001083, partial [Rhizophlyctis rosea]